MTMTRKKVDKADQLSHMLCVRVSQPYYEKMEKWLSQSNCGSAAELARRILYKEEIIWYHKDASLDATAKELAGIRNELKAIGTNINQITRYFNSTHLPNQKIFYALKVQEEYNKVGSKVDHLLIMISNVIKQWLQK
jgi:hypothetical protein